MIVSGEHKFAQNLLVPPVVVIVASISALKSIPKYNLQTFNYYGGTGLYKSILRYNK